MASDMRATIEYHTPEQVMERARHLEVMTFQDVLDLGIAADGVAREYNSRRHKGGMGNHLEERYFDV